MTSLSNGLPPSNCSTTKSFVVVTNITTDIKCLSAAAVLNEAATTPLARTRAPTRFCGSTSDGRLRNTWIRFPPEATSMSNAAVNARDGTDRAADFHALAVFEAGHQLFEGDSLCFWKRGGPDDRPSRFRNDWRESAGLGETFYLDQISRFRMVICFVFHKDAARRILHEELSAPGWFGGGDDAANEHGKLFSRLVCRQGKHVGCVGQNVWGGSRILRPGVGKQAAKTCGNYCKKL